MHACPKQVLRRFSLLSPFVNAKQTRFIRYYTFNILTEKVPVCYVKQKEAELKHDNTAVHSPFKTS